MSKPNSKNFAVRRRGKQNWFEPVSIAGLVNLNTHTNLATYPASPRSVRVLIFTVAAMFLIAVCAVVFGRTPAARISVFLPMVISAIITTELMTAYVFFGHYRISALPRLLFLGSAYLASGLLAIPYLLTFPRVFSATGLFGANEQTALYLWLCWHACFPALVLISVFKRSNQAELRSSHRVSRSIFVAIGVGVAAGILLPALLIDFRNALPVLVSNGVFSVAAKQLLMPAICLIDAAAIAGLIYARKPYTTTTIWLVASLSASALDTVMGLICSRYSYGWYAGKLFSLVSSTVVLAVYVHEMLNLQSRLAGATDELRQVNEEERRRAQERLVHLAYHDEMTNLPNRTKWQDLLSEHLERAGRNGEGPGLGVVLLDLDGFKEVNSAVGHTRGDEVLIAAAKRLSAALRRDCVIGRWGSDEFAVLIPRLRHDCDVETVVRRVLETLRRPFDAGQHRFEMSASVGSSEFPQHGTTAEELVQHAGLALYRAKRDGGGHWRSYSSDMSDELEETQRLKTALARAIRAKEFVLHYQPLMNIKERRIEGVEALIRWIDPERGVIGPSAFIPAAENMGLMQPIGRWVLETAVEQGRRWRDAGQDLTVSLNVSVRQLQDPGFFEHLRATLRDCSVAPRHIQLEVTESAVMADAGLAIDLLTRCNALGVQIALDDFGTHYSSLTYLQKLPIDTIKIDRSFVQDLPSSDKDGAIVRGVIALGHDMRRKIVAEGVETRAQFDWLQEATCDGAQGYFVAKPAAADQLGVWEQSEIRGRKIA